jgi:hypothetical protein
MVTKDGRSTVMRAGSGEVGDTTKENAMFESGSWLKKGIMFRECVSGQHGGVSRSSSIRHSLSRKPLVSLLMAAFLCMAGTSLVQAQVPKPAVLPKGATTLPAADLPAKSPTLAIASNYLVKVKGFTANGGDKPGDTANLVLTIETSGSGSKDIPWSISDGANVIVTGIERGVPAGKTIEVSASYRLPSGPAPVRLQAAIDSKNTLGEPDSERANNLSQVIEKSIRNSSFQASTGKLVLNQDSPTATTAPGVVPGSSDRPGLTIARIARMTRDGGEAGDDLLFNDNKVGSLFRLEGLNLGKPGVVIKQTDPKLHLQIKKDSSCGPNCLLLTAGTSETGCGYENFTLSNGQQDASSRVFVTPTFNSFIGTGGDGSIRNDYASPNSPIQLQFPGHTDGLVIVPHGTQLAGQVKYVGSQLPSGVVIDLTTTNLNNVQISPSSIPVPAGTTNATFNFQANLTNPRSNCLTSPVKINARIRQYNSGFAETWRRVAIGISPQP